MSGSGAVLDRPAGIDPAVLEQLLVRGDLRQLTSAQKISYYHGVCQSIGLNPLTQPFAYIVLNGKEQLYAKKDATDQLRKVHEVSIDPKTFTREVIEGCYVVTASASLPSGRTDVSTGAVAIDGLKGEQRANALMKSETKAKRRVTLSICGLGMLDETEVETIPQALLVEAPKERARIAVPAGAVQILSVLTKEWGGEITVVDAEGVEALHKTGTRQCAELAEQLAQEGGPVVLQMHTITRGTNVGKQKVVGLTRWSPPPAAPAGESTAGEARPVDDAPF